MDRYEYRVFVYNTEGIMGGKVDSDHFRDELNRLGGDGWELVSCVSTNQGNGYTRSIVSVFKRKIQ